MIQQERELRIYDLLQTYRVMRVEQLAAELKVTPATVRNDLTRMMRNGLVKRVHGGAILAKDLSTAYEIPFSLRRDVFQKEKQSIGQVAAGEVSDGQTIILDVSTTVLEAARNLRMRKNLIVITNAIHIWELIRRKGEALCHRRRTNPWERAAPNRLQSTPPSSSRRWIRSTF